MGVWHQGGEPLSYYDRFIKLFQRIFKHTPKGKETGVQLLLVTQGKRNVAEYAACLQREADGMSL